MVEQLELISICSAESADSPSRADGQESKPSHSAKSKNTPSESCEKTSQEFGYSKTFGNFQQLNFASLSCLPEDTRASLSALPASAEARKMTAISGLRCLELSEHQGRLGYSLKMLLDTLRWASTKCLLTWKAKTTPSNRLLFQLAPWTPRTDEIESGLLPTPRSREVAAKMNMKNVLNRISKSGYKSNLEEIVALNLFPTPTTQDSKNDGGPSQFDRNTIPLNAHVKMFPTPQASDANKSVCKAEITSNQHTIAKTLATEGHRGALNPMWVEWLMGYPIGWTDCEDSETQSCRKSHTKSSKQ